MAVGHCLLCVSLLAALSATVSAQDLKPWKHGVIEPKGDAGFMLMVGQRDFGTKHKLKIEIVPLKNGATAHKALLAGELDSIESSPGATILAGAHGADIKILGCDWPGVPHGLMVKSSISKVEDLRGKTIAVAAPGSLPNLLINAILEQHKIPARSSVCKSRRRPRAVQSCDCRCRRGRHRCGRVHGGRAEGSKDAGRGS